MSISSLSNNRYFILFIDDFTKMTWVYFLFSKAQVLSVFRKFKDHVEKKSGFEITVLMTDNGEYASAEFKKCCDDNGIQQQFTVSYPSEHNGVSERKNRTIMEMAKSMMSEKNLPRTFWAEAVYTVVYLLNRLPARLVEGMTPIEAGSGSKPFARHLSIFGSVCYTRVTLMFLQQKEVN